MAVPDGAGMKVVGGLEIFCRHSKGLLMFRRMTTGKGERREKGERSNGHGQETGPSHEVVDSGLVLRAVPGQPLFAFLVIG